MIIIDSHEDIAYNMLNFGRDYSVPMIETRRREQGTEIILQNGDTLLGRDVYVRGRVALVIGTLFALPAAHAQGTWERLTYRTPNEAHSLCLRQIDAYHRLAGEHPDQFRLISTARDLKETLAAWQDFDRQTTQPADKTTEEIYDTRRDEPPAEEHAPPVGIVLSMEGADGILEPEEVEFWWEQGVRLIGTAWMGTSYSGGTNQPGPLTSLGFALLEEMSAFGFGLDLSHMDEEAALQALERYPGTILASHSNAKALLKGSESNRHLTDRIIEGLIERDGVMGIVPTNSFLKQGWRQADGKDAVSLELVVAQIDYVCQMAGSARNVGLGTDFDGGFGWQAVPAEVDSIADLQKIPPLLRARGYTEDDIALILAGNTARLLAHIFKETE